MRVKDVRRKSKPRIDVSYLQSLGIQGYGDDNLYPETFRNIVESSSTGSECVERFADFIEGRGFKNEVISELIINGKGETMDDIHANVCRDIAMYNGFALHLNYNIHGSISEIQFVPFENCRLVERDDWGFVSHIAVHPDWTGKKTRRGKAIQVNKSNVDFIHVFHPDRNVVLRQIEADGGIENYKGQILWLSMAGAGVYPVGRGDRVVTEMSTDEGLSNVRYRNTRCGFNPSGMIITRRGSASALAGELNISEDEALQEIERKEDAFHSALELMQGDSNTGKLLEVTIETDEEKPEFVNLHTNNYDKEYTATEDSTVEHIYSAFGQEAWYCIRIGRIGFSGDILTDAFNYYNSSVNRHQRFIERAFKKIFEYWKTPGYTDFSIEPLKYVSENGKAFDQAG